MSIKIGFVLLSRSQRPIASTRIAVLNMLPFLCAANFDPHIVFEPAKDTKTPDVSGLAPRLIAEGYRLVVFQKVRGESVEKLARELSDAGIKTLYCVCDLIDVPMVKATHATTVVTDYFKSLFPSSLQSKIHVVHDGIERMDDCKTDWGAHRGSRQRPLRAVLVTSLDLDYLPVLGKPPDWLEVTIVGRYPPAANIRERLSTDWRELARRSWHERMTYLRFLADGRIRRMAWDPAGVYDAMREADVGIIPIETLPEHEQGMPPPEWKVKSENRLTLKMSIGLPVIATPIPSYEPVIEQGQNGFLAGTREEWIQYLDALRDPALRQAIGQKARESVLKRYSMEEQARRLIEVIDGVIGTRVVSLSKRA
jgi:glycosyltransferase involved in cell wall biosynthesis